MIKVNNNFALLPGSYLFDDIAHRVSEFERSHPYAKVIRMGIGDVTLPLCPAVIEALHRGVEQEATAETFHGYGPESGHLFLRKLIAEHDYRSVGVEISPDEVMVSDGAKSDIANIGDLFGDDCVVAVTDPVYPVYVDSNVMAGRAGQLLPDGRWSRILYLPCTAANDFVPELPATRPDVIYLCYPNNPTGTVLTRNQLKVWVDYAIRENSLIIFDSAYEAYISDPDVPHSIYEIEGAKQVAIEVRSYSKTAGFTGLRCGYTVVPRELTGQLADGSTISVHDMWSRRQSTKFNGASILSQVAAAAVYTPEGREQVRAAVDYYKTNARLLRDGLARAGFEAVGGDNSPYVWAKAPDGMSSWQMFAHLLDQCSIVATPGVGFGPSGDGYMRFTGFASREATIEAVDRLQKLKHKQN